LAGCTWLVAVGGTTYSTGVAGTLVLQHACSSSSSSTTAVLAS
jgi:hypothetical protein